MIKKLKDYSLHFNIIGTLLKRAFKKWYNRDPFRESSIIAYNAIFSLPGLLVVVVTLVGYFFGADAVSNRLHQQIAEAMGIETANQVRDIIIAAKRSRDSWWATTLGIITILIGATGVFIEMQKTLNTIWDVKATTAKSGIWVFLKTRLFSFGLIVSIAFLLLISLVVSSMLSALGTWALTYWSSSLLMLFSLLNFIFSLAIVTVLFAFIFKILPDAKIKWNFVWIGAFFTAVLFEVGKFALGFYFGKANPGSGYGAAGSIILIMLWTSYSSTIIFFGAEFTKTYSDHYFGDVPATITAIKKQ